MELIRSLQRILSHPLNTNHRIKTLFKLAWWKTNQLFFHLPIVVDIVDGIKCICYPNSSFGSQIVYTKLPEYHEMNFVRWVLDPSDIFVDVGAGLGDYSLIASSKVKTGRIFAFEPDPVALNYIKENVAINNLKKKIFVLNKVVSDKNGFEKFSTVEISELSHITTERGSNRNGLKIPSVTLDSFLNQENVLKVKLIKIDVEGAEFKVLKGLKDTLKKKGVDYLIIEINYRNTLYNGNANKIFSFLNNNGYAIYIFDDRLKLYPLKKGALPEKKVYNILAARASPQIITRVKNYISWS